MKAEHPSDKFTWINWVCDTDVTHHFRIDSEDFFDEEFREMLRLAYEYGG